MGILVSLKEGVKSVFRALGTDVIRLKNSPSVTLLGLRNQPIKSIIDVGANRGQFAKRMHNVFPQAKIYCFEPLVEPYNALKSWASNESELIRAFNIAIGDANGRVEIHHHINHSPSSSMLRTTTLNSERHPFMGAQEREFVTINRLDDALAEAGVKLDDQILVKLDVQGFEDRVLRGSQKTLGKASACIIEVNVDALYEGQASFSTLVSFLSDFGFL